MDREPKLCFPAPTRPFGAPEVRGDLFPGLEEVLVHHQPEPWRSVESRTSWIIDRMGAADHNLIIIVD
jgi:hypothetical protein